MINFIRRKLFCRVKWQKVFMYLRLQLGISHSLQKYLHKRDLKAQWLPIGRYLTHIAFESKFEEYKYKSTIFMATQLLNVWAKVYLTCILSCKEFSQSIVAFAWLGARRHPVFSLRQIIPCYFLCFLFGKGKEKCLVRGWRHNSYRMGLASFCRCSFWTVWQLHSVQHSSIRSCVVQSCWIVKLKL